MLPNVDAKTRPNEEHPAQAYEAIPNAEPGRTDEAARARAFFSAYTFILVRKPNATAVTFDKMNPTILSSGR